MELFLVCIFLYSVRIQETFQQNSDFLTWEISVFTKGIGCRSNNWTVLLKIYETNYKKSESSKNQIAAQCVKKSNYGVISGLYFPVFSPNTGKYGPEITPYLDTFHAVAINLDIYICVIWLLLLPKFYFWNSD